MYEFPRYNLTGAAEMIYQPLYDTETYCNGVERIDFFSRPVGVDGKTDADTNMYLPNALPLYVDFLLEGIAIDLPAKLAKEGEIEFIIGSKIYFRFAPLTLFRRQILIVKADDDPRLIERLKNWSNNYAPYRIDPELMLVSQQNFVVSLRWRKMPVVTKPVRVRVELCGHTYRSVQ